MILNICRVLALVVLSQTYFIHAAEVVHLYGGANDSVYLGCLNCIETDASSIWNEFGSYGSNLSQTSIWNDLGNYGGNLKSYSPFNDLASSPPKIVDDQGGFYGYLTTNDTKTNRAIFDLAQFIYLFWENIQDDVSSYYDLITQEPLNKYGYVNGMYIFAQDANQQYLGFITSNVYEAQSIVNPYGSYGSIYSTTSIYNTFSTYGSKYSSYSAYYPYATTPPIIYSYNSTTKLYTAQYYLTKNIYKTPYIDPDMLKFVLLQNFNIDWSIPSPIYSHINDLIIQKSPQTGIEIRGDALSYDIGINKSAALIICNIRGQIFHRADISKNRTGTYNLSGLPTGFYLIALELDGNKKLVKKYVRR